MAADDFCAGLVMLLRHWQIESVAGHTRARSAEQRGTHELRAVGGFLVARNVRPAAVHVVAWCASALPLGLAASSRANQPGGGQQSGDASSVSASSGFAVGSEVIRGRAFRHDQRREHVKCAGIGASYAGAGIFQDATVTSAKSRPYQRPQAVSRCR